MKKFAIALLSFICTTTAYATVTLPYSFTSGGTIKASEVNADFSAVANEINTHEAGRNSHQSRLIDILPIGNSCGTNSINFNYNQAEKAISYTLAADPTPAHAGMMFFNSVSKIMKVDTGSTIVSVAGSIITDGDVASNANISLFKLVGGTANQVVVRDGIGNLWGENQLSVSRGGTGTNSSAATGLAKVAAGAWSYASLVNSDVSASAAISLFKLAGGTANQVVFYDGVGNFASAAQLSNSRGGTGQNSSASTGLAKVSAGTWSFASLVDADISASAAISRFKLVGATANQVLVNDGVGNMFGISPGTEGNVLTASGGKWTSSAPGAGTVESWKGYHAGTSCAWTRTNTSYGDLTGDSDCTLTEEKNGSFGTVTTTSDGNPLPGISFTTSGVNQYYHVCATPAALSCALGPAQTCSFRFRTDSQTIAEFQSEGGFRLPGALCGDIFFATAASHQVYWECKATSGACGVGANSGGVRGAMDWSIHRIK